MSIEKRLAAAEQRAGGLVMKVDCVALAEASSRLFDSACAALPAIDKTRKVPSPHYSHAVMQVGSYTSSIERICDLGGRIETASTTDEDRAVLASLDAADLAILGVSAPEYFLLHKQFDDRITDRTQD